MRARAVRKMILLALLFTMPMIPVWAMGADSLMLVTPDEAARPESRATIDELNDGPTIEIKSPENGVTLAGPFRLYVEVIKKSGGSDINMESLTVTYLKLISVDITDRVRKYITGTKLDVPDADFPTGNHRALISIEDVDGKVSSKLFYVTVTKP